MPLERKTPLRSSGSWGRNSTFKKKDGPISKEGAFTRRWRAWRMENRALAAKRANGVCEWHHSSNCGRLEGNHCFGRGNWSSISEPWASFHPFITMVCVPVHQQFHEDIRMKRIMQREALNRFVVLEPFNKHINWNDYHDHYLTWEPHEIAREIVRDLKAKGIRPDGDGPPA